MNHTLSDYATLVFDCDGVVLNSNRVKTDAFYKATLSYGEDAALEMVAHHISNGGISRYKKFSYFLEYIVPEKSSKVDGPKLDDLLAMYADKVKQGLLSCELAEGLIQLRQKTQKARWLIASGGDQNELRDVFSKRDLTDLFDGGIFGSPDSKDEIINRELKKNNIQQPALFVGDSKYDYAVATAFKLEFLFLSGWTEVADWLAWTTSMGIDVKHSVMDLAI